MTGPSTDPRIERARDLYVNSKITVRAIARGLEVPTSTVTTWMKRYDWPRRKPKLAPADGPLAAGETSGDASADAINLSEPKSRTLRPSKAKPSREALRKRKRPNVTTIVDRLYRVLTHNLEIMETRMSEDDGTPANEKPERDLRTIGTMVRSVEKLNDLETEQSKRGGSSAPTIAGIVTPEEEDRIRRKVIDHILRLRERKRREGDAGQP